MRPGLQKIWRLAVRRWPFVAAGLVCLAAVITVSCCRTENPFRPSSPEGPSSNPPAQASKKRVAQIRVRLTDSPVATAKISAGAAYTLYASGQPVAADQKPMPDATVVRSGGKWRINSREFEGAGLELETKADGLVKFEGKQYRGGLLLLPRDADSFVVVNRLDLESYLAGVLARELYPDWPAAVYEALAVAARTFALYQISNFGQSAEYDVSDDQSSQCYGGVAAETPKAWQAVKNTRGWFLAHGPPGRESTLLAQYSSCCGGTVNGIRVLRDMPDIPPYQGGQVCEDCSGSGKYRWPPVRVAKAEIYRAMVKYNPQVSAIGEIRQIKVASSQPSGRTVSVELAGQGGKSVRVLAESIRLALIQAGSAAGKKLYSMNCRINDVGDYIDFTDGHGFGHGVGLCQWGAKAKADKGWTAKRILEFYYPGAAVFRAYE
ncbi:MAG: SpoIID/LytB domain-containing protein [Planctomycetes bacterium]|nr:SpoIID/LytB domain-containing protein [Planctomycetota bacterium]